MTYSRQQWDRAVGLYIRYECCAADAIHELGYPSKEALRMWYRERLEEERAGVPSRRGERQRRYSEEQKWPAQAETRAGARGVEAEGGGGGRVRKVEIA